MKEKRKYENKKTKGSNKGKSDYKAKEHGAPASQYDGEVSGSRAHRFDSFRSNDVAWLNKSPTYATSTKIPFNRIAGDPVVPTNPEDKIYDATRLAVPGFLGVRYIPTLGTMTDANSAINRCFNSIFSTIYANTSGNLQITQGEIAKYAVSFLSIATQIAEVKRVLEVAQLYSGQNYYWPVAIIKALGFQPESIIGRQTLIRDRLNNLILNFNALNIPDFTDAFKRTYSTAHNIYMDNDHNVRGQYFAFIAEGYYKYVDVSEEGSKVSYISFPDELLSVEYKLDVINECLEVWRNSSAFGLVSGSIRRAFPESFIMSLDYVTAITTAVPVYDRNINWQLNNSYSLPIQTDDGALDIHEDIVGNYLYQNVKTRFTNDNGGKQVANRTIFLNSYDSTTDSEFIAEAVRFMPVLSAEPGEDGYYTVESYETEIITRYSVHSIGINPATGKIGVLEAYTYSWAFFSNPGAIHAIDDALLYTSRMGQMTKFRHHPFMWTWSGSGDDAVRLAFPIGDFETWTTIDNTGLTGVHNSNLQSLYMPVLVSQSNLK